MFSLLRRRPENVPARRDSFWNLREEVEELFDRFFERSRLPEEWTNLREWEREENENEVVMRLELPGFEAKEIVLNVEGDEVVVRAEHPEVKEEGKNGRRHMESYEYRFVMPFGANVEKIEATYRNGILELHFPRLAEAKPKRIEVKT